MIFIFLMGFSGHVQAILANETIPRSQGLWRMMQFLVKNGGVGVAMFDDRG